MLSRLRRFARRTWGNPRLREATIGASLPITVGTATVALAITSHGTTQIVMGTLAGLALVLTGVWLWLVATGAGEDDE